MYTPNIYGVPLDPLTGLKVISDTAAADVVKVAPSKAPGLFAGMRLGEIKDAIGNKIEKTGKSAKRFIKGKGTPLLIGLDALTELGDQTDPVSKNIVEGVSSGLGTWGGIALGTKLGTPAGPWGSVLGALLGAILLSDAGKQAGGGIYDVVNPRGEQEHKLKQLRKAGELKAATAEIMRSIKRGDYESQLDLQNIQNMNDAYRDAAFGGF